MMEPVQTGLWDYSLIDQKTGFRAQTLSVVVQNTQTRQTIVDAPVPL
jgi:hypothetical protein